MPTLSARGCHAEEMKSLAIRNWLVDLHDGEDYVWETCSKIAGIMSLVFRFVDHNEICSIRNPLDKVTIPASEEDQDEVRVLLPEQVIALLERFPYPCFRIKRAGCQITPGSDRRRPLLRRKISSPLHLRCLAGDLRRQSPCAWYK